METAPIPQELIKAEFKPDGYVSPSDPEYIEQFAAFLESLGLNPDDFIYSGFNGIGIKHGWPPDEHQVIFGMDLAGWQETYQTHHTENNPAEYASGQDAPCIGIYKLKELAKAYHFNPPEVSQENLDDKMLIEINELYLDKDDDDSQELEGAFTHKDPYKTTKDALVGVVFLRD
ncbi:MAG TPA: hypothetical protein VFW52_03800 [Candidatus Saccharimonadales bacterium]|nr:hypothetical protein [Candidatus Saccharimonadales bacterium]